jgi:hypothetical protein
MFSRERAARTSAVALLATTLAISCSSSPTSLSPSASPSSSSSPSTSAGGATITGTVEGSARSLQSPPLQAFNSTSSTVTVSVVGTSIAATVASGESFTLRGVPTGNVTVQISGAGVSAQVTIPAVQNQEQIRVTVRVTDSSASITISERTAPTTNSNQARLQGAITSINAPTLTFVVEGVTVNVPAGVPITGDDHTLAFTDLKMGDRVTVNGNFSGTTLVASKVQVDDSQDDSQGHNHGNGEGDDHESGHGGHHD